MKKFGANQAINGSYGEVWMDDEYLGECTEAHAEIALTYTDVAMARSLTTGKKLIKLEYKGSLKMVHVRSIVAQKMCENLKRGKTPTSKIIMKVDDPDALGAERCVLYSCKFDKAVLIDFASGKVGDESYSFTYEDYDLLDMIKA